MAKTKSPLLSLASVGTIGNVLTTQKRGSATLLRSKPTPTYRYTLPQAYQRWLYEDYAYLWTQQSAATKALYRSAGVRFHLTAFQYWMKYQLTNLPGIAGMWHLDEGSGNIATDFSRNANHGTIFGASPADGVINGAQLFDGLNDTIDVTATPTILFSDNFTIELYLRPDGLSSGQRFISRSGNRAGDFMFRITDAAGHLAFFRVVDAGDNMEYWTTTVISVNDLTWHYVAAIYDGTDVTFYIDQDSESPVLVGAPVAWAEDPLTIGRYRAVFYKGRIDHTTIWTRALDATEVLRHSERSYPP